MVNIVVDNLRADAFDYRGSWATNKADQWFNATMSSSSAANSTVTITFNGTSVAFIGTTPPSSQPQIFSVSIDNEPYANTSFTDPNPSSYRQWYQSPTLFDGLHIITLSNLANASIDFALVIVGAQTPIGQERIVVDNALGIRFSAGWRRNRDRFNLGGPVPISGFSLSDSTHDTKTVWSSFSYKFSGTAISIYGLFDFSSPSLLVLSFSIDGQTVSNPYLVTSSSPQLVAGVGQQPNYLFYSFDFLTSGEHTLLVNVTTCVNQTFRFDYLTYVPSFGSASDMPTYAGGSSSTSPGTGDNGNRAVKTTVGAALGAVVGSVLLAVLLFFFLRRRTRRKNETEWINLSGETTSASNSHRHPPLLTTPQIFPHSQLNNPVRPMAPLKNSSAVPVQRELNIPHVHAGRSISSPAASTSHAIRATGRAISVNVDPPSYSEVT